MASFEKPPSFSKWRARLWPISSYELKKFIPLLLMKFCVSLNYWILTSMKDAMVVTAQGGGAEVIPVLKGWVVLPAAVGAALLYSKLSNILSRSTLFYGTLSLFLGFIFLYGFVLFPNMDALSPHKSADWLLTHLGESNSHWIALYRNWIPSLFFVVSELWAGLVIFLLFWGFVNQICHFNEAKRSYNLFIAGGDIAQITIGPIVWFLTSLTRTSAGEDFQATLQTLCGCAIILGLAIAAIYWWMQKHVLTDARLYKPIEETTQTEPKTKLSLWESLKFITRSKHLLYIAIMVVAYGFTINLVEVSWKANLKLTHADTSSYQSFMAGVSSVVGIFSLLTTMLLSGPIVRSFGWRVGAMLPPVVIGGTSLGFLLLNHYAEQATPLLALIGLAPTLLLVFMGSFHNISSKVMKYAFFDSTKEMAFVPLDEESKVKGKAAIDLVGSRLGKSGAAWIQIFLIQLAGTGSVLSITSYLIPLVALAVIGWAVAVRNLGPLLQRRHDALTQTS